MPGSSRKLVIQIPCLNEAAQLPITLAALPKTVVGFETVEWLVIDDGSTDDTAAVARRHGAHHVVSLGVNRGLAAAFMAGLETALKLGADVIVNTDADNQYDAGAIPALVAPVLAGRAHMTIGARPIAQHATFSPLKKRLQQIGSWAVRLASGTRVADATSGFRAISRELAARLYVYNPYTYTLETIIQAGRTNMRVMSVPVGVNPDLRESRLIRSMWGYVRRSGLTILRIFIYYKPLRFFALVAVLTALPGVIAFGRFFILYLSGGGAGNIQSLVIGAASIAAGFMLFIGGLLADLVAANRALLQEIRSRQLLRDDRER